MSRPSRADVVAEAKDRFRRLYPNVCLTRVHDPATDSWLIYMRTGEGEEPVQVGTVTRAEMLAHPVHELLEPWRID